MKKNVIETSKEDTTATKPKADVEAPFKVTYLKDFDKDDIVIIKKEVQDMFKTSGQALDDYMKLNYGFFTEYKMAQKADPGDLDLQYQVNYLYTRY